jgi:hypothetical protein
MNQRQIRLENLPLFISCFVEFTEVLIKYLSEIDGEMYVTVEYNAHFSFDEDEYKMKRSIPSA